jgi:hypothetical protein
MNETSEPQVDPVSSLRQEFADGIGSMRKDIDAMFALLSELRPVTPPADPFKKEEIKTGTIVMDTVAAPRADRVGNAVKFLTDILTAGPAAIDDLIADAAEQGITRKNLARGRRLVGAVVRKIDGRFSWVLPKASGQLSLETTPPPEKVAEIKRAFVASIKEPPTKVGRTLINPPLKDSPEIVTVVCQLWPTRSFTAAAVAKILRGRLGEHAVGCALHTAAQRGYLDVEKTDRGIMYRAQRRNLQVTLITRRLNKAGA